MYDENINGILFELGDLVCLHSPALPRGQSRKLHQPAMEGAIQSGETNRRQHL